MGDPFWRRFSSGKDRSTQHTKERALASEYATLNTRHSPVRTTGPGERSRNDLFSTDWKWKGAGEEQQGTAAMGGAERALGLESEKANGMLPNLASGTMGSILQPAVSNALPDSPLRMASAEALAETTLGAPFQLRSPIAVDTASQATSPGPARRSRNDTIYNVNHLTITPPGKRNATDNKIATQSPTEASFQSSSTIKRPEGQKQDLQRVGSTLRHHSMAGVQSDATGPSRSVSLDSTSSCGDSAITSFTEQVTDRNSPSRQTGTGIMGRNSGFSQSPISPIRSPTTPMTPDALTGFSSSTQQLDGKAHGTPTSGHTGWDGIVPSPQSHLSLSRSSSLTIAQSPSRALSNIKRKAEVLLSESAEIAENEHVPSVGDDAGLRVRADIGSRFWLIGYGRYAKVFLGSYHAATTGWTLCAAKVFDADPESVDMAGKENAVLRYLHEDINAAHVDGRPYILESIALVDDNILEAVPAMSIYDLSQPASATGTPTRSNTLTKAPTRIASNGLTGGAVRAVHASHRRSASETTAMLRNLGRSVIEAKTSTTSTAAYRPILLLPFCANGTMATFLKAPEAEEGVDETVWSTWFQQGLAVLAWCEEKGILHNDIKVSRGGKSQKQYPLTAAQPANFLVRMTGVAEIITDQAYSSTTTTTSSSEILARPCVSIAANHRVTVSASAPLPMRRRKSSILRRTAHSPFPRTCLRLA